MKREYKVEIIELKLRILKESTFSIRTRKFMEKTVAHIHLLFFGKRSKADGWLFEWRQLTLPLAPKTNVLSSF